MLVTKKTAIRSLVFSLLIILPVLIYMQGLPGDYVLDDLSNIVSNPLVAMQKLSWVDLKQAAHSMPRREISRASFGINYYFGGFNPYGYKLVNIIIHVINGLLVFWLSKLLITCALSWPQRKTTQYPVSQAAILIALIWVMHPINVTSVLYVVQRMTSLSALFILSGMIAYISGRRMLDDRPLAGFGLILSTMVVFLPLAWFSKENGALLPIFLVLVEGVFFRFRTNKSLHRKILFLFYFLFLAVPAVFAVYYIYSHPGYFHGSYFSKYYTMAERLMTETRVLWHYLRMILLPSPSVYGLYLDDIALSTGLLNPVSTLLSMLGIIVTLAVAWVVRKNQPILSFGIFFFFAGHLMESSFIPLEIAFEHRNYLPAIGILIIAVFYLLHPSLHGRSLKLRYASLILFLLVCIAISWSRVLDWSNTTSLHIAEVAHHPLSPRANYEAGRVYGMLLEKGVGNRQENIDKAFEYFTRSTELREDVTSSLFGMIVASHDAGIALEDKWFKMLEYRLEHQPYEQSNIAWIGSLTKCIKMKKCTTESTRLESMLQASERSKKTNRRTRALIFTATSDYYIIAERSLPKALEYSQKAVKEKPSQVELWLQLARLQILSHQKNKALKTLDRAKQKDKNEVFQNEILKLRKVARKIPGRNEK